MTDRRDAGPGGIATGAARIGGWIERGLDAVLALMILVMTGAIVWQVFARYVLDAAPNWSEELARFLMPWVAMVGSAAVLRGGGHVSVTALVERLGRGPAAVIRAVRDLVMLAIALVLIVHGYNFAELNGFQDSPAFEVPMSVPYAAMPVGGVLILLMVIIARLSRPGADWALPDPDAPVPDEGDGFVPVAMRHQDATAIPPHTAGTSQPAAHSKSTGKGVR